MALRDFEQLPRQRAVVRRRVAEGRTRPQRRVRAVRCAARHAV